MLVSLQNVNKVYQTGSVKFQALEDINFNIKEGEFVAIVGASGSGKSTLMNIIGLLDKPTSGKYLLDDQNTGKLSQDKLAFLRNEKIGFVFQDYNLLNRTSALDNVALPLTYAGLGAEIRRQKATQALIEVGLEDKTESKPNQLSGGQQQRVAIARALVTSPQIILADEPTGNLDSETGTQILTLFEKINKEGKTIILITHDIAVAKYAKRKIVLKDGRVV